MRYPIILGLAMSVLLTGCHHQPASDLAGQAAGAPGQAQPGSPSIGGATNNPDVTELVAEVDVDGNGEMSRSEWAAEGLPMSSFDMFEKGRGFVTQRDYEVNAAPPGVDVNGDGKLTVAELVEFDKRMAAVRANRPPPPGHQPNP